MYYVPCTGSSQYVTCIHRVYDPHTPSRLQVSYTSYYVKRLRSAYIYSTYVLAPRSFASFFWLSYAIVHAQYLLIDIPRVRPARFNAANGTAIHGTGTRIARYLKIIQQRLFSVPVAVVRETSECKMNL